MSTTQISITLQEQTLEKLDKICGLVPRSAYIENVLAEHLKKSKGVRG